MTASNGFLERERQMIAAIFSDAPGRPLGPGSSRCWPRRSRVEALRYE